MSGSAAGTLLTRTVMTTLRTASTTAMPALLRAAGARLTRRR